MQNFNTNQTRYLYVAGAVDSNLDTNLDIAAEQAATGEFYFKYKNADGLITRSDTIDPKKVVSFKKTAAAKMAKPLIAHTITLNTANYADLAAIKGKTLKLVVTAHQIFDFDDSNSRTFTITYTVPSSAANLTAVYTALDSELDKVIPVDYATISSSSSGLVITEKAQKYVRGKLSAGVIPFSVSFGVSGDNEPLWGVDTAAPSGSTISGTYDLADLEYFAAGEKGDYYRGSVWPNDYPFTPAIDLSKTYDVVTIEYYWAGEAENVQKSPRVIQIAADSTGSVISTLESAVAGFIAGTSGSGSGA